MNQENQLTEQNSEETEIDLLEIFYLLRAKLVWLILAFVIGGVIAGSITHFLITPKYTATAKMYMISASSGSVLDLSDFNIGTSLSQDYTELIKIRPVFNEVIDNLNLDMEYEDLLKKVSISVVGDSRLLAVSVEDNDPKLAQSMVNELVDTAVTYIPKVMNASENAQPTIAEYAVVPDEPSSPNLAKNIILGAVVAMLLVAVIFVVRMLMDATQLGKTEHVAVHLDHIKYIDFTISVHVTVDNDRVRRNLLTASIIQLHDIRCYNCTAFLLAVCTDKF